jgi:SAM-dependent methyltransferase
VTAPLLDIGCGPGRMVRAAAEISVAALGIDVSLEAVELTSSDGTPALQRSVFDRLPLEGGWGTVLLMDGNIGIGGDPVALLERCGSLLAADGALVVEVDADGALDETAIYTAVDESGNESGPFPWARIGHEAVRGALAQAGLRIERQWSDSGRYFVRARRSRGTTRAAAMTSSTTTHTPSSASA